MCIVFFSKAKILNSRNYNISNFSLFSKPIEVRDPVLKNIYAGFLGNLLFPLVYLVLTDVKKNML